VIHDLLIAKILLGVCSVAAIAYYLLAIVAGWRFFSRKLEDTSDPSSRQTDGVSIMIPLRGADWNAHENYAGFCEQEYQRYQIVFGVQDPDDPAVPIVQGLIADYPQRDIALVICADSHGQNAKVSNLQNMLSRVKHDLLVIVDSDIRVGPDYLREVTGPLAGGRSDLVTCLYRAAAAPDFGARLEAVGLTGEFMPGVLVARMLEGVRFALGSTMATTRARLEEIGGFQALADYLADDFMLGNLIAEHGREVTLSHHVVETAMTPVGFAGFFRHQMRWARSTRISRPLGYLGLGLTYGTATALLFAVLDAFSILSISLLAVTLGVRLAMAWVIGVHWLRDKVLAANFWIVPVRDLLSFAIWVLSWTGRRVEWRGRVFEVSRDGKMILAD
jgi:ceramide glucosyltransferase